MAARKQEPPVPAESFAEELGSIGPSSDRLRLAGLDHAARIQAGRVGSERRRLLLEQARRPQNTEGIAQLQRSLAGEQRAAGAYTRAVGRAEVETIVPDTNVSVLHGFVYEADGTTQAGRTVAAIRPDGSVRRFTCTDAKGYFRIDLTTPEDTPDETVFLQVSDADQVVLYRGDEAIRVRRSTVHFRVIMLSGERLGPCPIPPERASMPRVLDLAEVEALVLLERFGLSVAQRHTQTAPGREGRVLSQEPPAGTPIEAGTEVTLVIATAEGGNTVAVPALVRLQLEAAEARLAEAQLATGRITQRISQVAANTVLEQVPAAGTLVNVGTAVDLVVAIPRPDDRVEVPEVTGLGLEQAFALIEQRGLQRGRTSFRDDQRVGIVIEQSPGAGTRVAPDTPVNVVVGRRGNPDTVDVPTLLRRTLDEVREVLAEANLTLGRVTGPARGRVTVQQPRAGARVPVGSAVDVTLALELEPIDPGGGGREFAERVMRVISDDEGFANLGVEPERLRDSLIELGVEDAAGLEGLVELGNAELRDNFGLANLNQARTLRRILRTAAETLR